MKFRIIRASDYGRGIDPKITGSYQEGIYYFVEINSLEELMKLCNQDELSDSSWDPPYGLYIEAKTYAYDGPTITIRDTYLE